MGFLFPLESKLEHERFLAHRLAASCPFCLPAGPSQMVEVFCKDPVEFSDGAIVLAGTFETLKDHPSGMYYRMRGAELLERHDDIRWTAQLPQQPKATQ
jgi:uncharacterized protein